VKKRILSTIGLWSAIALVILLGKSHGAVLLLTVLAVLAQHELYIMLERIQSQPWRKLGLTFGALMVLSAHYGSALGDQPATVVLTIAVMTLLGLLLIHDRLQQSIFPTLFGIVLIPFMLQFYVLLMVQSGLDSGYQAILLPVWVVAVSKFSDVGGLLIGSRFGRNKLSPLISPNKTWEGVFGGIVFSAVVALALGMLFQLHALAPLWMLCVFSVPIAITSIFSDLVESYVKRMAQMKDSGNIIPGIGGAFDLIDSLLFTGPVAYILFRIFVF